MAERKNNRFDIGALIAKSLQGQLTAGEAKQLADWLAQSEANRQLMESIRSSERIGEEVDFIAELDKEQAWRSVKKKRAAYVVIKRLKWGSWAAAVLIIGMLSFWMFGDRWAGHSPETRLVSRWGEDLLPASDRATLILPNGEHIHLVGDTLSLSVHTSDGTQLVSQNGELHYRRAADELSTPIPTYNTLAVPKAGMFRLVLPDSTRVWLAAESKLHFPVSFTGTERRVFLEGEAFFEVNRDAQKPFVVNLNDTEVTVLGTSFNVNTFAGVATTLVSGSVRVTHGEYTQLMLPGQQAKVVADGGIELSQADLEKTLAWKSGEFVFSSDKIVDILDDLSRWYGFEVTYIGRIPEKEYTGGMARSERLSAVLEMLAYVFNADFDIEGTTVVARFEPE